MNESYDWDENTKKHVLRNPAVIAKAGTYKEFVITNSEGRTYDGVTIRNAIGYKSLGELFEKVELN